MIQFLEGLVGLPKLFYSFRTMKMALKSLILLAFGLNACGQETERIAVVPASDRAQFSIREPKLDQPAESVDGSAKKPLDCNRIEANVDLPSAEDPCVILPSEVPQGIYSLSRVDLVVEQIESKERLQFSRSLAATGKMQIEDQVRRSEAWGASTEVLIDLNLPLEFWKEPEALSFQKPIRHQVQFDKLSAKGSRLYELLEFRVSGDSEASKIKIVRGSVDHARTRVENPDTSSEIRIPLEPLVLSGSGVFRRVETGSSKIQAILQYSIMGLNGRNYLVRTAYEYSLLERPATFRGSSEE
jgi:hypothetical protein